MLTMKEISTNNFIERAEAFNKAQTICLDMNCREYNFNLINIFYNDTGKSAYFISIYCNSNTESLTLQNYLVDKYQLEREKVESYDMNVDLEWKWVVKVEINERD